MADWRQSLPDYVKDILDVADDYLNDFAGNVRIAEALNELCFKRAVEGIVAQENEEVEFGAYSSPSLNEEDMFHRFKLALQANKDSAAVKAKRLEMIDKYEDVNDIPRPILMRFETVEAPRENQIERLKALGFYEEAEELENA